MGTRRRTWSAGVSIGGHALVFAALGVLARGPSPTPAPEESELTVVELIDVTVSDDAADAPLRLSGQRKRGEEREATVVREPKQPERRQRPEVRAKAPRRKAVESPPEAAPEVPETSVPADGAALARVPVPAEPAAAESPELEPTPAGSDSVAASAARPGPVSVTPRSSERGRGGRDEDNFSGYGASIVRAVVTEIDRVPIGGLRSDDSIQLVLEVLPDGRLASVGRRKSDVARVGNTTLGRIMQRQVLRRVARASKRFPPHPAGFTKARFVVEVTVRFRDLS